MARDHGPQIKDDGPCEALRRQGAGREKAARLANTGRQSAARRGGKAPACEVWTRDDLYQRAKELDIDHRSAMSKGEPIDALRQR